MYSSSSSSKLNNFGAKKSKRLFKAGANIMGGLESLSLERTTTVRIKGKFKNQNTVTECMIDKTLEEQEKIKTKQKELQRANERLKNLEKLEKVRQEKVKEEIERLEQERKQQEETKEKERKENIL